MQSSKKKKPKADLDLFPRPLRDNKGSVRDSDSGLGPSVVIPHVNNKRQFDVQKAPHCVRTLDAL